MKKIVSVLAFVCVAVISGCKGNEPVQKVTPANLTIEPTISDDGSGLVTFQATADFAERFEYYFGDDTTIGAFKSADGTAAHFYLNTGTYAVKVIAVSSDFTTADKTISIDVQVTISDAGYSTPDNYTGMTLAWQDEFNGTTLNTADWTHETGGNWYNNELQYYQEANTTVGDGYLVINAKKENVGGKNYTSSRIKTQSKKVFQYGRVDIRALLPKGQGIWPALWMLGSSITTDNWPKCGEIDIMEMIGGGADRDNKLYGTLHWDEAGNHAQAGGSKTLTEPSIFADEFHVFSIIWTADKIEWYLDDVKYYDVIITAPEKSEVRKEFFFLFNVAVGGDWPGNPDGSTPFPQRMVVDYIRVFQ